jgi:hypothetical protein
MDVRKVAVLVADRVSPFELGVACEVFGTDRSAGRDRGLGVRRLFT